MTLSLDDSSVLRLVQIALSEDIATGDVTAEMTINEASFSRAYWIAKDNGIVCGLPMAALVFRTVDASIAWTPQVEEGAFVEKGAIIAELEGSTRSLLTAERTALNFVQRMSGVATKTRFFQQEIAHTNAFVLDTRKTIPAWRLLDKYSVKMGGGKNHRMGLFDMIMIKDNHIAAAGSITKAVEQCRDEAKRLSIAIEVETQTLDDVREALACGDVDRIMFDNFTPELMKEAVAIVNKQCETEASGNITLETIRSYAETGVDFISSGALTHSVTAFDISMKFHEE